MKVAIDARMVRGRMHGIARHVVLLAEGFRALAEAGRLRIDPIFIIDSAAAEAKHYFEPFRTVAAHSRFLSLKEIIDLPKTLKSISPDLYHSPSFSSLVICPCPHVATVHDLNHLKFGSKLKRVYYRQFLMPFCKRSRAIMTVSKSSAEELSQWLKMKGHSPKVIPSAIDLKLFEKAESLASDEALGAHGLASRGYFLAIYSNKPHKGFKSLLEAYARYREKVGERSLPLALVGGPLSLSKAQGFIRLPSVDDLKLAQLMAHSRAFLFPSLYEGLGLPPVEAVASGAKVVLSDISAHREAVQGLEAAVFWAAPGSTKEWVMALAAAGDAEPLKPEEKRSLNEALKDRYSSEKMALAYQDIYVDAASKVPSAMN